MAKTETVHDVVFEIYSLKTASTPKKEKVRKFIKRQLNKIYPDKTWNDLSKIEQDTFIFINIRQKMLDTYVDGSVRQKVCTRIDKYMQDQFKTLYADKEIKKHNDIINAIYENYYDVNDSESAKREKYHLLCTTIKKRNAKVPLPSYEDWCLLPLRPYDYIKTFEETPLSDDEYTWPATESQIDHVLLHTLLKGYTELTQNTIDINRIKECLTHLNSVPFDVDDNELLDKYDPNINLSREEQEKIIQANRKYYTYKKMLDDLDFIIRQ